MLSDLSWTMIIVRAEPCVENRKVRFFSTNRSTQRRCIQSDFWAKWILNAASKRLINIFYI